MTSFNLREETVNDFIGDFEEAALVGSDLSAKFKTLVRRSPDFEPEIREAMDRVIRKFSLPNAQNANVTYSRETRDRLNWYQPDLKKHPYWPVLRKSIEKELGDAIESIDDSSTNVINGLRPAVVPQKSRGLVLGYVQSGKTTNFMSVIAKAADAGFRLIIVLTGITDNLRQQTQDRLDDQLIKPQGHRWTRLTSHESDFSGDHNAQKLANTHDRFIAVVKKNAHRLSALNEWISSAGNAVENCPILVIDDEADQASIDVSSKSKTERSAINRHISQLLDHQKTAYIAYTATPFANILIDPNDTEDLYPRDFIVTLPEPEGYFGSRKLFGRAAIRGEAGEDIKGFNMIRDISESEVESIRPGKDEDGVAKSVTGGPALAEAIRWFLLASAARRFRGQSDKHSSMLIHTSMLTDDHKDLYGVAVAELNKIKKEFGSSNSLVAWSDQWAFETQQVRAEDFGLSSISFESLVPHIEDVLAEVKVIVDNGRSENRLDYQSGPATVIAIGGNTLSRGLTLEGLVSSYFVRRAAAYDTLLQMGRWFGFRKGYEDLPRIWMPEELQGWFYDLATIEAELRDELAVYMDLGYTPLETQARVRVHPEIAITSRAKMQDARTATMSFSGKKEQTIKFHHKNQEWLQDNIVATRQLISDIRSRGIEPQIGAMESPVFIGVPHQIILDFLSRYHIHESSRSGVEKSKLMRDYIEAEISKMRLRTWNVSIITQEPNSRTGTIPLGLDEDVVTLSRARMKKPTSPDANIKALVTTFDRLNDVILETSQERREFRADAEERSRTGEYKENGREVKKPEATARRLHKKLVGPNIGHLAIYPIDKDSRPRSWENLSEQERQGLDREPLDAAEHVIGVGIFFPETKDDYSQVNYVSAELPSEEVQDYYRRVDEEIVDVNEEDETLMEESEANGASK